MPKRVFYVQHRKMSRYIAWPAGFTSTQRQDVVRAAKWSRMAYSHDNSDSPGLTHVTQTKCTQCDADCITFGADDDTLVVAVRGTDSPGDMLCDVQLSQTLLDHERMPDVLVHTGFHTQFRALLSVVDQRVTQHLQGGGKLVCTGHSLGAGVAALFAVWYGVRFPAHVSYFGFGSPRQGNYKFANLMQSSTVTAIMVKNHRDPVCSSILPTRLLMNYGHAGLLISIGKDLFPDVPNLLFIQDHDIQLYVENLEAVDVRRGWCVS